MKESVLHFDCEGDQLIGVLCEPAGRACGTVGALIVVGGPQYRAGSHRQFVTLARRLGRQGICSLRFDYRGMGDGGGAMRDFRSVGQDIAAAVAALLDAHPPLRRVVLFGLCDAAAAILMHLQGRPDPRIAGLILQNPWVRSAEGQSAVLVKHYYVHRLRSADFWLKFLKGGVGTRAIKEWIGHRNSARKPYDVNPTSFQEQMERGWKDMRHPALLQLSGADLTAREFIMRWDTQIPGWRHAPGLSLHEYPGADHTFSNSAVEREAHSTILTWWQRHFGDARQEG